jgi:hypothetical protein
MEKGLEQLRKIIEECSSKDDLELDQKLVSRVLEVFDLIGIRALVILERPGKHMGTQENGLSSAALMTFLTQLFIENPSLHGKLIEKIIAIKAKVLDEPDENPAMH